MPSTIASPINPSHDKLEVESSRAFGMLSETFDAGEMLVDGVEGEAGSVGW
jgi:hypothetical protein